VVMKRIIMMITALVVKVILKMRKKILAQDVVDSNMESMEDYVQAVMIMKMMNGKKQSQS
jgi:hypothetical protein